MTDPQFSVDPTRLRHLAGWLDALAGQADRLAGQADRLAGQADRLTGQAEADLDTPSGGQFPASDVDQRAAELWTDARRTTADGLRLVRARLAQLAAGYRAAAGNHLDADTAAARQLDRSRPPGADR
jgi:hypothetical protein